MSLAPPAEQSPVVAAIPDRFAAAPDAGDYRPAAWWSEFKDPVLDSLLATALANNLDIAQAAARADRAAAQARVSRAALGPALNLTLGNSYSQTPLAGTAFGNFPGGPTRLVNETFTASAAASYELDLFGRVRNDFNAARSDAVAAEFDYRAARLATAAEVISAYFELVDARFQIDNNRQTLEVLGNRAALTEERYQRGLAQSFELYQLRQDLRNVEAGLPLRESARDAAQGRLALLLAEYPAVVEGLLARDLLPRLVFEPVPASLPAALLGQRPDVAAAWERLEGARLRIGARRAERFPSLQLNATVGGQGGVPLDAFAFGQNWLVSLGSSLVAPVFDNGRISGNIAAARATYDEQAAAYGAAVLNAYNEANLALADYERQRERYRLIVAQLDQARFTLDLQARRFRSGVGDYVDYLDALRGVYQVESSLATAGRDVALARLGVHRALAGDWESNGGEDGVQGDQAMIGEQGAGE